MDALAELDRIALDPAIKAQVSALVLSLAEHNQKTLAEKDAKIAALTHELAYYKRIRFGQKTEALAENCSCIFCIRHVPVACGSSARSVPGRR